MSTVVIGLVCIDVDGTLIGNDGEVAPRVWDAAARARACGIRLAINTGRPGFGIARRWAAQLDPEGWHVFQNGASVIQLGGDGRRSSPLPRDVVAGLVARAAATGRALELYGDDEHAVEQDNPRTRAHAALLGIPFRTRAFDSLMQPVVRAQWLLPIDALGEVMAEPRDGLEVVPSTSPLMPDTVFVNLTGAGISKHVGVRAVAAALGLPRDEVMVVGDALNDLRALQEAGFPVAMDNAVPEVKAVARLVVPDVEHAGVADALEAAIATRRGD